jgi:transcriptional regulator with XRE-family HTH domain
MPDRIGASIGEARKAAGLTQEQLAVKVDTARSFIVRLEKGRGTPTTTTLDRIAKATGHRLEIVFRRFND